MAELIPAAQRAAKLLRRADVAEEHRDRLLALVERARASAEAGGAELQSEFGKEHVGLIVGCNQFARLWRGGEAAGKVELWLEEPAKAALRDAGFTLGEPSGAIFRMLGWVRVDPMEGELDALGAALDAAFARAAAAKKPA